MVSQIQIALYAIQEQRQAGKREEKEQHVTFKLDIQHKKCDNRKEQDKTGQVKYKYPFPYLFNIGI